MPPAGSRWGTAIKFSAWGAEMLKNPAHDSARDRAKKARRHRVLLDVTFKVSLSAAEAASKIAIAADIGSSCEHLIRPMNYAKTVAAVARRDNGLIKANIESAIDALQDARSRL